MQGCFHITHRRSGIVVAEFDSPNLIVNQGKNHFLEAQFKGGTQEASWYIGLIDSTGYSAIVADDTYGQIGGTNGWGESTVYYDAFTSDRGIWLPDLPSAGKLDPFDTATFYFSASGSIRGVFLCAGTNAATIGDTTSSGHILWSASAFSARTVTDADDMIVTYQIH